MIKEDINNLKKYSKTIITVYCDDCGVEKKMMYKLYTSYGYSNGEYLCRKCKLKKNNQEKWGVDNVFQIKEIKDKIKKTNLERWGVENVSQSKEINDKKQKTCLEKYGETHHLKNDSILEKQKQTNLERWGVENVSQLEFIKNEKIKTCNKNNNVDYIFYKEEFKENLKTKNIEKWGVEYSFQSQEIKDKIKQTNLEKWGDEIVSKNNEVKSKIKKSIINTLHAKILKENKDIVEIEAENRIFKIRCNNCNNIFEIGYFLFYKRRETNTEICTICNKIDKHQSGKEILLYNFIKKNYNFEIIQNYKIEGKEIDVYLPNLKLGFEFNGIHWHSELFKNKNFHKEKTDICRKNNIQLIHIWEDDWDYKGDIVKSMILNKMNIIENRIFARKCQINNVKVAECKKFLNENHIQGYTTSSCNIGLYYNDELVSLMCFKKKAEGYELNRFCSKLNTIVIGSASKLLNFFILNYSNKITTFSNNSYSYGNLYEKIGFKKICELMPDYHYIISNIRVHKFNLRNKDTSNIYRIYDAGKIKYQYIT